MSINVNTEQQLENMLKRFLMEYLEVGENEIEEGFVIDFAQKEAKNISFNNPVSGHFAAFISLTKDLIGSAEFKQIDEEWQKRKTNFN